jgi:hypothetical protein
MILIPLIPNSSEFEGCTPYCGAAVPLTPRRITMKKLTISFWLALAAAGIIALQAAPSFNQVQSDLPFPTCPPDCPISK